MAFIKIKSTGEAYNVPEEGSPGLLALGWEGLKAWKIRPRNILDFTHPVRNFKKKRVLLVGWDGAEWEIIHSLMDKGMMPSLEKLVNQGVSGKLSSLAPMLSPMLWTSIATGKTAEKHGILGFLQADTQHGRVIPVRNTSRTCVSLWNILSEANLHCNVISWWPSFPVEKINGCMVSDHFFFQNQPDELPETGDIYPGRLSSILSQLQISEDEITQSHILPFLPDAYQVDQQKDRHLAFLVRSLAHAASVQSVTSWLMDYSDWDFTAVYFSFLDHLSHMFMKYYQQQDENKKSIYAGVIEGAYIFQDMMLDGLLRKCTENDLVLVVSDHGFKTHFKRDKPPKGAMEVASEHNPYGIFVASGQGIKKDELVFGASILDITPTILHYFNQPVGKDMDGKVLQSIFVKTEDIKFIDSWEQSVVKQYMESPESVFSMNSEIKLLENLGYIDSKQMKNKDALISIEYENQYHLARVYQNKNLFSHALQILEKLHRQNSLDFRVAFDLCLIYLKLHHLEESRTLINELKRAKAVSPATISMLELTLHLKRNEADKARELLEDLSVYDITNPVQKLELANAWLTLKDYSRAADYYNEILKADENQEKAWLGLGLCHLRTGNYKKAAECFLQSIGLLFHQSYAHFYLGEALYHMNKKEEALKAFLVARKIASRIKNPEIWVERITRENQNPEHFTPPRADTVFVVSGFPRSGTSLMMQILLHAGMPLLTDNQRYPDVFNPHGYFEYEPVKNLPADNKFLELAVNKAVKIVAPLLNYLPHTFRYRIIFMDRNPIDVISSQMKMLGERNDIFPYDRYFRLKQDMERIEDIIQRLPAEVCYISYDSLMDNATHYATLLTDFTGYPVTPEIIKNTVDRRLFYKSS